ncbi:MAG: hypothetical protein ACK5NK_05750 [Niabella sp.]
MNVNFMNMDVERFGICSRLAYCFEVCSTRLLEPILAPDIIFNNETTAEGFTGKGKQNVLQYFEGFWGKEKKHKHPYSSQVFTAEYFYGISIGRLTRKSESKMLTLLCKDNKIEVMKVQDQSVFKSMQIHPYPFFDVTPEKTNFLTLCQIAIEDYKGLQDFTVPDEYRKSSWIYVFTPLYEFLKITSTKSPIADEFNVLFESCTKVDR